MSEVVYFELGTKELQVVPKASLSPINNYEKVERIYTWGYQGVTSFKLIDIGGNKNFMSMPLSQKLETTNRHLATLHWDDNIPLHLKKDRWFWVGPIDTYVWRDKPVPCYFDEAEQPGPSNRFQRCVAAHAAPQSALTGALQHADTSMPPLQFGSSDILQQRFDDLRITPPQSESSTAPLQLERLTAFRQARSSTGRPPFEPSTAFRQAGPLMAPFEYESSSAHKQLDSSTAFQQAGSSTVPAPFERLTAFRQPGPLMPPFEYKPSTARRQLGSSTAPRKSGSSTVHIKPGSSSAGKDGGPPTAPPTPANSSSPKAHKQSGPRTAPLNSNLSKALKQPRSWRYIPYVEPLNLFRQADQPDPLMPPFEYEAPTTRKQSGLSTPSQKPASSTFNKKPEVSSAEKKNSGPPTTALGRKSGSSIIHNQSGPRTAPPKQHDSSKAQHQPGSWRRQLQQSGLLTAAGQPDSSTAQPAARSRAAPAKSGLLASPAEEEAYRSWWSDDGHDSSDKGR